MSALFLDHESLEEQNIKIEQNEKMIKKNKVIELYSKGERCVRKLSQLTGVPLTTVYRVIGKLKGINYNIPRGNGAGRKTILDAQDREILVEILNVQPRISRKALGKELFLMDFRSMGPSYGAYLNFIFNPLCCGYFTAFTEQKITGD